MPWLAQHLVRRTQLHDLPQIHYRHPVAHVPDHRDVVRDQHVGQISLLLQATIKIEDLLDGNISALVGSSSTMMSGSKRARSNSDALALSRKCMRQAVKIFRPNAHLLRQRLSQLTTLPFAAALLYPHRLGNDAPDG